MLLWSSLGVGGERVRRIKGPAEAELEREEMPLTRTKAILDSGEFDISQVLFFTKGTPIK